MVELLDQAVARVPGFRDRPPLHQVLVERPAQVLAQMLTRGGGIVVLQARLFQPKLGDELLPVVHQVRCQEVPAPGAFLEVEHHEVRAGKIAVFPVPARIPRHAETRQVVLGHVVDDVVKPVRPQDI